MRGSYARATLSEEAAMARLDETWASITVATALALARLTKFFRIVGFDKHGTHGKSLQSVFIEKLRHTILESSVLPCYAHGYET